MEMAIKIRQQPEVKAVEDTVTRFVESLKDLQVSNKEQFEYAEGLLREAKQREKQVDLKLGPVKDKLYAGYKEILDLIKEIKFPLITVQSTIKERMKPYLIEQEKIRQARIEEERKRQEDARIREAEILAKLGQEEKADKMLEKKITVSKEIQQKEETGGTYTTETWSAEITDIKLLCKAIGDGTIPVDAVLPNMPILNRLAREQKDAMNIPGVKAVKKVNIGMRL
jgi:hypothetical protein